MNSIFKLSHIIETLRSVKQKFNIIRLFFQSWFELSYSIIVLPELVLTLAHSIKSSWIFFCIITHRLLEVIHCFSDPITFQLADAHIEVGERIIRLDFEGFLEI